jgi:CheY-like chemotaxis protein
MKDTVRDDMRIWIAEDDDEFRVILGDALTREDRVIKLFKNGQEVSEAIKKESFDILLTDLMMPEMDGIQTLNEVKKICPESIVIIITGYASLDTAIQAIRGGAYDYLRKPFKLEELEVVIKNACEKISLIRDNRRLLQQLKEAVDELNHMKKVWDGHLANILDFCWTISDVKRNSEMQLILNQIDPTPPDYALSKKEAQSKKLDSLEKLIQFKKEGFIDQDEFLLLKKILLQRLNGR